MGSSVQGACFQGVSSHKELAERIEDLIWEISMVPLNLWSRENFIPFAFSSASHTGHVCPGNTSPLWLPHDAFPAFLLLQKILLLPWCFIGEENKGH